MAQGLGRGPCADAVIARARGNSAAAKLKDVGILGHRVSDPDELLGFLPRAHSDVDEDFMKFRHLLPIVGLLQVDRQMASDPRNWTASAMHKNPAAAQHSAINAANTLEIQIALLANVRDHQAELVRMPNDGNLRSGSHVQFCEDVAICIALDFVSELPRIGRPYTLTTSFEAGGRRCFQQCFEEIERSIAHKGANSCPKKSAAKARILRESHLRIGALRYAKKWGIFNRENA